jgi:hypothetical protein
MRPGEKAYTCQTHPDDRDWEPAPYLKSEMAPAQVIQVEERMG